MAPQRLRNINRFDRNRFVSLEADEWEKEAMQYPLIEERGLALTEEDDEQIQPVLTEIEPRRWTKFARNPGPAVLMLVREFYSNMDVTTNASTVRGRTIFFAPSVINRMYETPDLEEEALQALLCNPVWDDEIAPGLCPLGIEWHVDQHGQRDWFPTKNLSLVAKVWMLFLSSRLEPNRNTYEIRPRRARWLYAIMHHYPINVGRIICDTMKRCRTKKSVKSMSFGSTITLLIEIFGNPPTPDFGFVLPSNIGMPTLRALGPCVGLNNGPGRRPPGRGELAAYFERLDERIDHIYNEQQQIRHELVALRAMQIEHMFYTTTILQNFGYMIITVVAILRLPNIPTTPPFALQNTGFNFPVGQMNCQPPPQGNQVLCGEVAAEIVPHPGAQGNHVVEPGFVDPAYAGCADIEMELERPIGMASGASVGSGMNSSNIVDGNGASSSTTKE